MVTRPDDVAERTARGLRDRGHQVLLAPVLTIVPTGAPPPAWDDVQAILVTSRQAVLALAGQRLTRPVWSVGQSTADAARAADWPQGGVGAADGTALADLLSSSLDPKAGALVHARGRTAAPGLATRLKRGGFDYRPWIVYAAEPVRRWPPETVAALADGGVDAITFHSPDSARAFLGLIAAAEMGERLERIDAFCLSEKVAQVLGDARFRAIHVAAHPNETAMGTLLEATGH